MLGGHLLPAALQLAAPPHRTCIELTAHHRIAKFDVIRLATRISSQFARRKKAIIVHVNRQVDFIKCSLPLSNDKILFVAVIVQVKQSDNLMNKMATNKTVVTLHETRAYRIISPIVAHHNLLFHSGVDNWYRSTKT